MIIVEGIIGAGKSTLVNYLSKKIGKAVPFYENTEHGYLVPFYNDIKNGVKPSHHAFAMQFFLLTERFRSHSKAVELEWKEGIDTIHDRSIFGDEVFANMLREDGFISDLDFKTYMNHANLMHEKLLPPHVCAFLKPSPEKSIERIKKRSRDGECSISIDYLKRLEESHYKYLVPKLEKLGTEMFEFDWNSDDPEKLGNLVLAKLEDAGHLRYGYCKN